MTNAPSRPRTLLLFATLATFAHGCASCDSPPEGALTSCEQSQVFAGAVKTDILFVIDDSGSMSGEQDRLRIALSRFINTLATSPIADDFQIAVTTTAVETFGGGNAYTNGPSAGVPFPDGIAVAVDPAAPFTTADPNTWGHFFYSVSSPPGPGFYGPRILRWDDPTLVSDFEMNVLVGTDGSGREQPFAAMEGALTTHATTGGQNEGFLRPGSRLAVIFLSDEDDCSGPVSPLVDRDSGLESCDVERAKDPAASALVPISHYVDLLRGPLPDASGPTREVVLGAVVGVTCSGGTCTNELCSGALRTPNRILELLTSFDPAGVMLASVCDASFDSALDQFANAVMGQTLPLVGTVADPRLLVVTVTKPTGRVTCEVAGAGTAEAAGADAVYWPPVGDTEARLTFQSQCALAPGDTIDIDVICAG